MQFIFNLLIFLLWRGIPSWSNICSIIGKAATAWKVCKYGVISGLSFLHSDWIWRFTPYISKFSLNAGKYGPEITPYLDTFHAVRIYQITIRFNQSLILLVYLILKDISLLKLLLIACWLFLLVNYNWNDSFRMDSRVLGRFNKVGTQVKVTRKRKCWWCFQGMFQMFFEYRRVHYKKINT